MSLTTRPAQTSTALGANPSRAPGAAVMFGTPLQGAAAALGRLAATGTEAEGAEGGGNELDERWKCPRNGS